MPNHKSDFKNLVNTLEKLIRSDDNEAKRILEENGIDPIKVGQKGENFVKGLISEKLSIVKKQKQFTPEKWKHQSVVKLIDESLSKNPIEEIKERARNLVLKGFENGWSGPPFNPIELVKILGMDIKPDENVLDASITPIKKGHLQIVYNPFQKPTRVNFSIAHEIAHSLFSDCEEQVRNREEKPRANWELEFLCNMAASEILLPYAQFSNEANNTPLDLESLLTLSNKYQASLESVFLRFTEVVDKDCAIAIASFDSESKLDIEYFKPSGQSSLAIERGFQIPQTSKLCECKSPGWTARGIEDWSVFDGKKQNIYGIGLPPLKRENKPRVGIFFVPVDYKTRSIDKSKIVLEYGDATKPRGKGVKIIAQVVNTSGGLGFGFGKSLSKNYPVVKEELAKWSKNKKLFRLGSSNLVKVNDELYVFQMLAQKGLFTKDGEIPLKYTCLQTCLSSLANEALDLKASIHMPQIGAGQAKGDWNLILGMIHDELISKSISVNIYILPGAAYNPKAKSNLTIFKEDSTWQTGKLF